jgi:DNA transformation protein
MAGGFQDLLADLFEPVGGVSFRRMFGGIGIFRQGIMFALVADDALYLKADDTTATGFKAEGCGPFVYDGKSKPHVMPYWRLPERLYDDPDEFRDWALAAFRVAEQAKEERPKRAPRPRKRKTSA